MQSPCWSPPNGVDENLVDVPIEQGAEKQVEWAGRRTWGSDNRLLLSPDSGGGYAAPAAFKEEFNRAVLR
jgi:hypothetical protein